MNTTEAVARLNQQLPLQVRQARLSEAWCSVHRSILWSLVREGRTLSRDEIAAQLVDGEVDDCLNRLVNDDLVVMTSDDNEVLGAYPVTTEQTAHAITVLGQHIYAMCALDALSVAPVFDCVVKIESSCHVSGTPIVIEMHGHDILAANPSTELQVGIRWQKPVGHAAYSMCMEMVFLKDGYTASHWQGDDIKNTSRFDLPAAVEFAATFFKPLVK